ncbi:histidinol dehydrogenase [soil metagenome]
MRIVVDETPSFHEALETLAARGDDDLARVELEVRAILEAVKREGDEAVLRYAERFDHRRPDPIVRRDYGGAAAFARLPLHVREALELAAARIKRFHERERETGFRYTEEGVSLGCRVRPLARVAVYAPGGKARYPSSVLMSAIPATVAGVADVLLVTPLAGDGGVSDDAILAAAHLSGVTGIVDLGGAHGVGAVAYGTATVPKVDKIVGPGNIYVACAKRLVFGTVAIDGVAGPSEILVVADDEADPRWIAADLLSQAEHDEAAYPLLLCNSVSMAEAIAEELTAQLETLPRKAIAQASLDAHGVAFVVKTRARLVEVADRLAVEHVSLQTRDPEGLLAQVRNAGAIFLGPLTPEAAGDYLAGPSHVLPTGGTVRFGSPLGVYDFYARTSVIGYSAEALGKQGGAIATLARLEGLEAHARAVEVRTLTGGH